MFNCQIEQTREDIQIKSTKNSFDVSLLSTLRLPTSQRSTSSQRTVLTNLLNDHHNSLKSRGKKTWLHWTKMLVLFWSFAKLTTVQYYDEYCRRTPQGHSNWVKDLWYEHEFLYHRPTPFPVHTLSARMGTRSPSDVDDINRCVHFNPSSTISSIDPILTALKRFEDFKSIHFIQANSFRHALTATTGGNRKIRLKAIVRIVV